jgi:autotransporter-associated beta strand protein
MTCNTGSAGLWTFAATSGTQTITSAGKTLRNVTKNDNGTLQFSGATTLTGALTFTGAGTLRLPASLTTTVGSFVTTGTTLKYLTSSTPGTQATISDASGTNAVTYLSIQDSNAIGGASWNASSPTNVDAGNNTGWVFGGVTSNYFLLF